MAVKRQIDVGGDQGRHDRDGIVTYGGGRTVEHGLPIDYAGDEPDDCSDLDGWVVVVIVAVGVAAAILIGALAATAGYMWG